MEVLEGFSQLRHLSCLVYSLLIEVFEVSSVVPESSPFTHTLMYWPLVNNQQNKNVMLYNLSIYSSSILQTHLELSL